METWAEAQAALVVVGAMDDIGMDNNVPIFWLYYHQFLSNFLILKTPQLNLIYFKFKTFLMLIIWHIFCCSFIDEQVNLKFEILYYQ